MVRITILGGALAALCLLIPGTSWGASFGDAFEDSRTDSTFWSIDTLGGPTIHESDGTLAVDVPASATGSIFYARYVSVPLFVGDFDAQVDYRLDQWPSNNGLRVGLSMEYSGMGMACERLCFDTGGQERYLVDFGGWSNSFPTGDTSGTLRWVRSGSTVTAYCLTEGTWTVIGSTNGPTEPVTLTLWVWSHDSYFGHQDARILFDNFMAQDSAAHERLAPIAENVRIGKLRSGSLSSLAEDDEDFQVVAKFLVPNMTAPIIRVDLNYVTAFPQPTTMTSVVRLRRQNAGSFAFRQFQYDYSSAGFVPCMTDTTPTSGFQNYVGRSTGDLTRFVRQSDGQTTVRLEVASTGVSSAQLPAFEFEFACQYVSD